MFQRLDQMGKAARWLKSFLGMKKDLRNSEENHGSKRGRRRWSFGRSAKDSVPGGSAWLGRYLSETEREQNNHAIAVAAATAAAADAAVAAAQAAVAVVRLTSQGSSAALFCVAREKLAAVKIQTVFRGYLARKALRALKGLVKLQAHMRGFLVRKQRPTPTSLRRVQSLTRTHSSARHRHPRNLWVSQQRFDESRCDQFHSSRISAGSYDSFCEDSHKIVEVDTFRTKSRSSRKTSYPPPSISDLGVEGSGYFQYPAASLSPAPARLSIPDRHYLPMDWGFYEDKKRRHRYHAVTAHSTPRCAGGFGPRAPPTPTKSVCDENEGYFGTYYDHHGSSYDCPNYMANTLSFRAKVRSQSAPRHRPEPSPSKRRLSMNDVMASKSSVGGVRLRKSCSSVPQLADL